MKKKSLKNLSKKLDLNSGIRGLKVSFVILLALVVYLFANLVFMGLTMFQILYVVFRTPTGADFLVIFAGFLLFIVIPFIMGIKLNKN